MTLPDPRERPTLTVPEAGRLLGLGRSGAYDAADRGEIPSIRVGGRVVVPTASLLRLLGVDALSPASDLTRDALAASALELRARTEDAQRTLADVQTALGAALTLAEILTRPENSTTPQGSGAGADQLRAAGGGRPDGQQSALHAVVD